MPNFKYTARDKFSKLVSGQVNASDTQDVVKRLRDMGYAAITITQQYVFYRSPVEISNFFKSVKLEEVNTFTRQLYSLQKAGIPLLSCLESIGQETENKYFQRIIMDVAADVRQGISFSDAISKHRKVFDEVYVNMMKAAESGGLMVDILDRLANLIEQDIDTHSRVSAATKYPMIAFITLCLGFLVLIIFVIPRFTALYSQFNAQLPLPTRILIGINVAIKKFWYIVIPVIMAIAFLFMRFIHSKAGRPVWDNLRLKVPVFGPLVTMLTMSRFARITAVLMKSGVPILEILNLVANSSGNIIVKRAILNIRDSVNV
ncbi:MAG: type II secretion system F family protein [Candidatus Omnitrophota bacterium]